MTDGAIIEIALKIAARWRDERQWPSTLSPSPPLRRLLNELDDQTQGDARRCDCETPPNRPHADKCPARTHATK